MSAQLAKLHIRWLFVWMLRMESRLLKENTNKRDVKINIRAKIQQRYLIDQAAEILGKNRSDFMLEAACQKAEDVILEQRVFSLNSDKWLEFLEALDAPPQHNEKLQNLLNTVAPWEM